MASISAVVRSALAARFGPSWIARTTEEIAADPALAGTFGDDTARRVVRFLSEADRAKFDDREGLQPPEPAPEGADRFDWLGDFVIAASAGASSTINGK